MLDTLSLHAFGAKGNCLLIRLSLAHPGAAQLRAEWYSDYELIDPPFSRDAPEATVDSFIRARLDTVFSRVKTGRLEPGDLTEQSNWTPYCGEGALNCVRATLLRDSAKVLAGVRRDSLAPFFARLEAAGADTAEARAIVGDIRRSTRVDLQLAYGYETVERFAYSPRARRFFLLFACC